MPRSLDHIVHAVRDLDAAADLYARLGFTVGARNKHSWGTHNRIVQFDGAYIELLEVGEPEKIEPHGPRSFSFGAFHRDFLAREQGIDMLLLNSHDANADAAAFRSAGIGDFDVFDFERQGQRPDGSIVKLAFSLAFAADPKAPQAGFGTCQHYFPENFWNSSFQQHANGVQSVASVVLVAENAAQHRDFLLSFSGASSARDTDDGLAIDLARGMIEVMKPGRFGHQFGAEPPTVSNGARLAAVRFGVPDIAATAGALRRSGVDAPLQNGRMVVGPLTACGAVLIFEGPVGRK